MKKEASIKINQLNDLSCPICDGMYLHQGAVKHYNRENEDDCVGMLTVVTGNTVAASSGMTMEQNPSLRRNGFRIEMSCETCNDLIADLAVYQHKGATYISWMFDEDV